MSFPVKKSQGGTPFNGINIWKGPVDSKLTGLFNLEEMPIDAVRLKRKKYEGCRNLFGLLRENIIKRLEAFFAHPSQETWDDVYSLIIGANRMKTPIQITGKGLLNQDELGHRRQIGVKNQ